jgi:hypothetical protein|tara:strand:- start:13 stop:294 length:282 start_codon:yes stop_codon:yes gene_type:complete
MKHTELWNTARKLKLGTKFLEDLDTLITSLESNNKQLIITDVVKSFTAKDNRFFKDWLKDESIKTTEGKYIYRLKEYTEEEIWKRWYYNDFVK